MPMKRSLGVVAAAVAVAGVMVRACPDGLVEISVEKANGAFCAAEPVCVADRANGACPGPQEGLPDGSYCGVVASGVYGCKMGKGDTPAVTPAPAPVPAPGQCADGQSPMSVEGVEGVFCTPEPACVADRKDGACPGPQPGLEGGSFCGIVQSGVYGCKVQKGTTEEAPANPSNYGDSYEDSHDDTYVDSHDDSYVDSHDNTYVDSHDDTYVDSHDDTYVDSHDDTYVDSHDDSYVDSHDDSYVDSHDDTYVDSHDESYEDSYGDSYEDSTYYDAFDYTSVVADCSGGSDGDVPVKVVGFGVFCAVEPVCGGDVLGNCPHVQDGLNFTAVCANVHHNRFGCVEP